jgi:hypothetical protein
MTLQYKLILYDVRGQKNKAFRIINEINETEKVQYNPFLNGKNLPRSVDK